MALTHQERETLKKFVEGLSPEAKDKLRKEAT